MDRQRRYFGVMVETMPTPMNSIARMQTAMSQCSTRCSGVKRRMTACGEAAQLVIRRLPSRFADSLLLRRAAVIETA